MGKQKWCWLLGTMVLAFLSLNISAQTQVPQLYEASLTSQSQSQAEWQQLVAQGLVIVLERISGSPAVKENPHVVSALQHSGDFVEQYSYEGNDLVIKYSPELINQLVQKMGHHSQGLRPAKVILWLAIEDNHQRRLVGQETDPTLQIYLEQIAKLKGIPLILPLMDLEDMSTITVTDVWGQFPTILQAASSRYGAQIILLGRLMHTTTQWEGNWQILAQDAPSFKTQGETLEGVLAQGFSGVVPYLKNSHQSTITNNAQKGKAFLIGIEGVQSAADFNNVENYLKKLNPVMDVNIHQLFGALAIFEITPRGDNGLAALEQALSVDQHLIPSFSSQPELAGVESTYRWVTR